MKVTWKLNSSLHQAGLKVVKLLKQNNFQVFWVGGIVRNILLKRESDNIDIATDTKPDDIEKILEGGGIKTKPVGKQFGSILAIVNNFPIEITTFRSEGRYSDNRHPDQVEFIQEYLDDAKRRDFTINALYFDPIKKEIYDPANGLKDLKGKLLRFVGDPKKRIDEDALRMLRGVRLATQLGFKLEKNSFAATKTRAKYIQGISGERVKAELDKILFSENRVEGVRLLDEIGLLRFIVPELSALKKFSHKSKTYHLEGNVFNHTMLCIESIKKETDLNLFYATLFHDTGKSLTGKLKQKEEGWVMSFPGHPDVSVEIFKKFAQKLKFPRKNRELILWLIKAHDDWKYFSSQQNDQKAALLVLDERFPLLYKLWFADMSGNIRTDRKSSNQWKGYKKATELLKKISSKKDLLEKLTKGELIIKYGKLKPGPALGQKIDAVKVGIVLGKIKNEKDLKYYFLS